MLGHSKALRGQWRSWPAAQAITGPARAEEALRDLEGRARPASVFQLAEALHAAEGIVLAAPDADALVRNASRVGSKLLEWYAAGQMIARGTNHQHPVAGPLLAAASAGGWGSLQRTLAMATVGRGFMEADISTARWTVPELDQPPRRDRRCAEHPAGQLHLRVPGPACRTSIRWTTWASGTCAPSPTCTSCRRTRRGPAPARSRHPCLIPAPWAGSAEAGGSFTACSRCLTRWWDRQTPYPSGCGRSARPGWPGRRC